MTFVGTITVGYMRKRQYKITYVMIFGAVSSSPASVTNLRIVLQPSIFNRPPIIGQTCEGSHLNTYINFISGRHAGYMRNEPKEIHALKKIFLSRRFIFTIFKNLQKMLIPKIFLLYSF